jgi:hypothetical protein
MRAGLPVVAAALLVSACAAPGPVTPPSRTPSVAEKTDAQRTLVSPYLACVRAEARKLGAGGMADGSAADASEVACGRLIQQLRRYGAVHDYDALSWSSFVGDVERSGRAAAVASAAAARKRE